MLVLRRASTSSISALYSTSILSTTPAVSAGSRAFSSSSFQQKRSRPKHTSSTSEPAPESEWQAPFSEQDRALVSSTPLKVRERRAAQGIPEAQMADGSGMTIVERLAYERLKEKGEFIARKPNGELPSEDSIPSPKEWLDAKNAKRSGLRGRKPVPTEQSDSLAISAGVDSTETQIVGRPVYLPDIVFRLIPNYTPPNEPYNPWEATFYVPHSITKLDVRSYLYSMYGLEVTYIRTDNYYPKIKARPGLPTKRSNKGISLQSRKRAVVGLKQPFIFPNMREDMTTEERTAFEDTLDRTVGLNGTLINQDRFLRNARGLPADAWSGGREMGVKNVLGAKKERRDRAETKVKDSVERMIEKAIQEGTHGVTTIREDQIPLPDTPSRS